MRYPQYTLSRPCIHAKSTFYRASGIRLGILLLTRRPPALLHHCYFLCLVFYLRQFCDFTVYMPCSHCQDKAQPQLLSPHRYHPPSRLSGNHSKVGETKLRQLRPYIRSSPVSLGWRIWPRSRLSLDAETPNLNPERCRYSSRRLSLSRSGKSTQGT